MGHYRAIWNVQGKNGLVSPGGAAELNAADAATLAVLGAIEPDAIAEAEPATDDERKAKLLALVPTLTMGDFTAAGTLRAEAKRKVAAQLGFEPTEDELRAAAEAYVAAVAAQSKTD